jgi:hypothetical protein
MICFSDAQLRQHGCGYLSGGLARRGLLNDGYLDVQRTKAKEPPVDDVVYDRHAGQCTIDLSRDSI